ncbi:MAG: ABC transporter ATP-binding protein, partial [Clostridia bacterium]|nr:ABC transporter ATP-binding protein [Clostridia bacterium]
MIEIQGLRKSFKEVKAVQDISFRVRHGEFFAFLGVNGAGKSTTISILCGQLSKDAGKVFIDGIDLDEDPDVARRSFGVVYQSSVLDKPLTVRQNLESRAALYGIVGDRFEARLSELCELLDLHDLLGRTVGKLSGGQRRRIDIARALIHRPRILILDEPTTGLDPQTRKLLWNVISSLRKSENMTVFLTTHYMEEAAEADYVVILDSGRIVANGTPHELKNEYAGDFLYLYGVGAEAVAALGAPYSVVPGGFRIEVPTTAA